jgi:hypothetical protein
MRCDYLFSKEANSRFRTVAGPPVGDNQNPMTVTGFHGLSKCKRHETAIGLDRVSRRQAEPGYDAGECLRHDGTRGRIPLPSRSRFGLSQCIQPLVESATPGHDGIAPAPFSISYTVSILTPRSFVPVQREMESGRSPLVSIPPFGRGFSRHGGLPIRFDFLKSAEVEPPRSGHRLDEPARLSLGMVASLHCPLPFRLAQSF